jgi:uncharacterized membrane protein
MLFIILAIFGNFSSIRCALDRKNIVLSLHAINTVSLFNYRLSLHIGLLVYGPNPYGPILTYERRLYAEPLENHVQ